MTTYGAYNAGLSCKNPSCRSYGKPHPNCRCYGEMAKGGEVGNFCDIDRKHQEGCQYFPDGGDVIDPEKVQIDEPTPPVEAPGGLPSDVRVAGAIDPSMVVPDEIPPDEVQIDGPSNHYDSLPQQIATAGEGAASGLVGAAAPTLETAYGDMEEGGQKVTKSVLKHLLPGGVGLAVGAGLDALKDLGMGQEDIIGRRNANPEVFYGAEGATMLGSMLTGSGELGAISKVADGAAKLANSGKVGSGLIKAAISGGLFQTDDEVSKWMLGEGDPTHPVGAALANIGGTTLLTGAIGGLAGAGGVMLEKIAESKVGGKLQSFLAGFGSAAQHAPESEYSAGLKNRELVNEAVKDFFNSPDAPNGASLKAYELGQKAFDAGFRNIPKSVAQGVGGLAGHKMGSEYLGYKVGEALYAPVEKLVEKVARPGARKLVAPVTMKILSSGNTEGLLDALKFAEKAAAGDAAATKGINSMMLGSPGTYGAATRKGIRDKIEKWIDDGGAEQEVQQEIYNQAAPQGVQGFAKGGDVKAPKSNGPGIARNKGLELHYPEQNMMLATARGRISSYLTSMKPQAQMPARPFDDAPDDREKKRSYKRALDIAAAPLSILDEIGKGTLDPDHLQHFNAMHPELGGLLKKKITESIVKAQVDGKKPPYRVRQALSMFMGTDLSGEMNPSNILAAQQVFASKAQTQEQHTQASSETSGGRKALSKSDEAFLTGSQAREKRLARVG